MYERLTDEQLTRPDPESDRKLSRAVDTLVTMWNASELAVDLAYGSVLFGDTTLAEEVSELAAVRGLLVMVPAFLAIWESVYGSLGSRLSTELHQGVIAPAFVPDDRLATAVATALANGIAASLVAAVATYGVLSWLGRSRRYRRWSLSHSPAGYSRESRSA